MKPKRTHHSGKKRPALLPISHDEFEKQVVQLAAACGFLCYHTRDSRGSNSGFPDWVFVSARKKRTLFVEVKVPPDGPTIDQKIWLAELEGAGQLAFIFYPDDWDRIVELLHGEGT
jgi:hypothetical protein